MATEGTDADTSGAVCSFCGGPPSGPGRARMIVRAGPLGDGRAAVCGTCIAGHAGLLVELERGGAGGDPGPGA